MGKSPIDAHLAVLAALRLDPDQLSIPRADGDREALRILLGTRNELTHRDDGPDQPAARTAAQRRRRRSLAGPLLAHRPRAHGGGAPSANPAKPPRGQAVRHAEIRRLARAVLATRRELVANRAQLQVIVDEVAPGLTERRGIGAISAAQAIVSFSHTGRCRNDAAFAALRCIFTDTTSPS